MNLSLHHHPSFSVIAVEGDLLSAAVENMLDLFSMVPVDQSLIVDLSGVGVIESAACTAVDGELRTRMEVAALSVVVDSDDVSMTLVLHDVDRVAPLVRRLEDAIALVTGVLAGRH